MRGKYSDLLALKTYFSVVTGKPLEGGFSPLASVRNLVKHYSIASVFFF